MCGIIGFIGKKEVLPILLEGLSLLEYRGYDSLGVAVINNKKINIEKSLKRIDNLNEKTKNNENLRGFVGIGHTRWATHGKAEIKNAHPHISNNKEFCVVHNGIIENYAELKEELMRENFNFYSDTDTEIIPNLIQKYYKGNLLEAVNKAKKRLKGSFAVGIISIKEPEKMIAIKKSSPIIIGLSNDGNFIASDVSAVAKYTKDVIYLEDGQTALITKENVEIYDENLKIKQVKTEKINFNIKDNLKDGYEHFMLKEICEQPNVIKNLINRYIKDGKINFEDIFLKTEKLENFNKIIILACGSAYYAGVVIKYLTEEILRIPTFVEIASEFKYKNPIVDEKTLCFAISQSGETADTISALKEAKKRGAYTISIVNVQNSSLAKISDDVIYTDAGSEIAVATTKAYLAQITVFSLFTLWMSLEVKKQQENDFKSILEEIMLIPQKIQDIINRKEKIEKIAKEYKNENSVFFIGRNIDYAVCLEASLKLKEISYIHSESYPAGELKHGTISLIEKGTKVIAIAYNDNIFEKTVSNIKEVKARGAEVLIFTKEKNKDIERFEDKIFYLPSTHKFLSALIEVIPFQLLAYYVAKEKNCDIDKPRNLAKSVTVE